MTTVSSQTREDAFALKMRKWREDRLLRPDELANLLGVELATYQAWEDARDLPQDLQQLALRFRSLQNAAGEKMHDITIIDNDGQPTGATRFGIAIEDVQTIWGRFMSEGDARARGRR